MRRVKFEGVLSNFTLPTSNFSWGCSSVGRASALQAEGRRFKSVHLHLGTGKPVRLSPRLGRKWNSAKNWGEPAFAGAGPIGSGPPGLKKWFRSPPNPSLKRRAENAKTVVCRGLRRIEHNLEYSRSASVDERYPHRYLSPLASGLAVSSQQFGTRRLLTRSVSRTLRNPQRPRH